MNFNEYYFTEAQPSVLDPEAWRERRVTHLTKTGQRNKIKIKYLPAEEQEKYKPQWLKNIEAKRRAEAEQQGKNPDDIQVKVGGKGKKIKPTQVDGEVEGELENPYVMDFYFLVDDPEKFNVIDEDQIIEATTDAIETKEEEDSGKYVVAVTQVPMGAIIRFKNEDDEWEKFDKSLGESDKMDAIKFGDAVWFKLNLFPFLKDVRFELLTERDENGEIKHESHTLSLREEYFRD